MRKLLFLLALGATAPALAQNPAPATQIAPTVPAVAPFNWRIHLVKGQKFRTTVDETSRESEQKATAPGEAAKAPIQTLKTEHLVFDQEVLSSDEKGARIELVYREAKRTSDEVVDENGKPTPNAIDFKAGSRFRYTVSPQGIVNDVQGVEEFVARIMAAYDQNQGEADADETAAQLKNTMRQDFEAIFSYEAQEDMLGKSFSTLPSAPLALGQTWTYNSEIPNMMGLEPKEVVTSTFAGREGDLVLISEIAIQSTNADKAIEFAAPAEPGGVAPSVKMALSGTKRSQVKVDEKTGLVRFSHSNAQSQSVITISITNIDGEGGKSEDVTDTVEESTSTTEMLPPETIVALPIAAAPVP